MFVSSASLCTEESFWTYQHSTVLEIVMWEVLVTGKRATWGGNRGYRWQHRHKWLCCVWSWELSFTFWGTRCSFSRYGRQFCLRICHTSYTTYTEGEPPEVDGEFAMSHSLFCIFIYKLMGRSAVFVALSFNQAVEFRTKVCLKTNLTPTFTASW